MAKGSVNIEVFKTRLRLVWSWQGKRFYLYVGLPDTQPNRKAAEIKARQIELDIASSNFDPSLAKYKPQKQESVTVVELFTNFLNHKQKTISNGTLTKYVGFQKYVAEFFKTKAAIAITESLAQSFREWLGQKLEPITVRERLTMMNACWVWAIKKKILTENPWAEIRATVPPKQPPQPFTKEEIEKICAKFQSDKRFQHYADYVEFKFGVGLRTGEAAALLWKHCSPDCDRIWIGESISRNKRKSTKTNKARTVPLTPRLSALLKKRRPENFSADAPIFDSIEGGLIDSKNFCRRYWKPALAELGIDYRRPYTTRHTLISHGLESGMNPVAIAALTGHDVRTLYESYAGIVNPPQLPDLFSYRVSEVDSQVKSSDISE
jgi:integrase